MTSPDDRRERYDIVARLGEAERRIAELQCEWARFRDDPSRIRLAALRRSVTDAGRSLDRLADRLDRPADDRVPLASRESESPNPRDLVAAGRDLDNLVQKARQAWSRSRESPDAASFEEISAALEGAELAVNTLADAFRTLQESGKAPIPSEGAGEPVWTLQQRLEQLREVWAHLQRRPTLAGTMRLRRILRDAREEALELARLARSGSPLADPATLSYLGGAAESVRFRPYRDPRTGTYNGRGFEVSADAELSRCARYGRPFGLVLLSTTDADSTSARAVIGSIRGLLRGSDLVGRTPRSEIALGLPESDGRATRRIAARILRALDAADHGSAVRRLSYAVAPADGRYLSELLETARSRLARHDADGPIG
ncbi:MAG: hypothetical protein P8049_09360 [Gemmatimonadota bacterium]